MRSENKLHHYKPAPLSASPEERHKQPPAVSLAKVRPHSHQTAPQTASQNSTPTSMHPSTIYQKCPRTVTSASNSTCTSTPNCMPPSTQLSTSQITFPSLLPYLPAIWETCKLEASSYRTRTAFSAALCSGRQGMAQTSKIGSTSNHHVSQKLNPVFRVYAEPCFKN